MMTKATNTVFTKNNGAQVRSVEVELDLNDLAALASAKQSFEEFVQSALERAHAQLMVDYWTKKRGRKKRVGDVWETSLGQGRYRIVRFEESGMILTGTNADTGVTIGPITMGSSWTLFSGGTGEEEP
jgi:hypothetical protein